MNSTIKTILLTVLTLSVFTIALIELSGVSQHSLSNIFSKGLNTKESIKLSDDEQAKRDEEVKQMPKTTLEVIETKFDFGHMKDGDKKSHTYIVKNVGKHPLVISNIQTSCGCTAPYFPKAPILPGEEGKVSLEFNSAGKEGSVAKNALIIANADNAPFSIGFVAEVDPK